jgi:sigma-B regulation protein RsbU (phosphoserine phosphatase)
MEGSLDEVRSNESRTILKTLIIGATLLLLALLTSMLLANSLVRPIKHMTRKVSMIQGDNMSFQVDDTLLTGDEIEILARSFENMSEQMQGYVHEIVQITSEKQRLETELSVASQIQEHMLPTKFPAFPDRKEFDLYAVMDPAREVGGDFYDYFLIDDDHLAVVMADVSGKGVPAALFMVISRTLIKNVTLSCVYDRPSEILRDVNNKLCEGNEDNMFVTAWLGILTISTGSLISSCAGHEYPVFYRKSEGFVIEKDPHGLAMGAMEGVRYKDARWKLHPGDLLFLYTDGVPEANNSAQELFGNDRMLSALENSRNTITEDREPGETGLYEFLQAVRKQIDDFVGDTPQFDDLTMLCMKYTGPEHGPENGI